MNTEKIRTLEQIHAAMDAITDVQAASGLTPAQNKSLDKAYQKLRDAERKVVRATTTALYRGLAQDASGLRPIITALNAGTAKLKKIAATIQRVADAVAALSRMATIAANAGIV